MEIRKDVQGIPGLYYVPNAVAPERATHLLKSLLSRDDWFGVSASTKSRRVLQFGYEYNYRTGGVLSPLPPPPPNVQALVTDIIRPLGIVPDDKVLNQCIVNKYEPGQGIGAHVDVTTFDDYICCFTLGSGTEMVFTKGANKRSLYVSPGSLYIMSGEARYRWKHAMPARKRDKDYGPRGTRLSVTFRTVKAAKADADCCFFS